MAETPSPTAYLWANLSRNLQENKIAETQHISGTHMNPPLPVIVVEFEIIHMKTFIICGLVTKASRMYHPPVSRCNSVLFNQGWF